MIVVKLSAIKDIFSYSRNFKKVDIQYNVYKML